MLKTIIKDQSKQSLINMLIKHMKDHSFKNLKQICISPHNSYQEVQNIPAKQELVTGPKTSTLLALLRKTTGIRRTKLN
jgi:hypothetical protein